MKRLIRSLLAAVIVMAACGGSASAQSTLTVNATRVIDTVLVTFADGFSTTVRLIGIDTPDRLRPDAPSSAGPRTPPRPFGS